MFKYYIYISTLKVNMLFDQIPLGIKQRVAGELKIDLKLVSATLKNVTDQDTIISKLNLVLKSIESEGELGDIHSPKEYFASAMNMAWAPLSFGREADSSTKEPMVIFGGSSNGKYIALIGSRAHLLGEAGTPVHADYARPSFYRRIADEVQENERIDIDSELIEFYRGLSVRRDTQGVEFVARTFLDETSVLLGSPLYVAVAKKKKVEDPLQYYC